MGKCRLQGIAMGNAVSEVKKQADLVIGSNDDDGIAEYLSFLLKGIAPAQAGALSRNMSDGIGRSAFYIFVISYWEKQKR